jgi:hypothetical protein
METYDHRTLHCFSVISQITHSFFSMLEYLSDFSSRPNTLYSYVRTEHLLQTCLIQCIFEPLTLFNSSLLSEDQAHKCLNFSFYIQCFRKVAVHLQKVLEVMSTSVETGLNTFNFIRKHFLQICVRKVAVHL